MRITVHSRSLITNFTGSILGGFMRETKTQTRLRECTRLIWVFVACKCQDFIHFGVGVGCKFDLAVKRSIWLKVWEEKSFEEFQDGRHGATLDIDTEQYLQFWISTSHQCLPLSFGSIWLMVLEEMSLEEFQYGRRGGRLGYQNGTILEILNLYVTVMPPIKFRLNRTYGLGEDVVWRSSRWPPWRLSWISERNDFSILNLCDAPMPPVKFWLNGT